MGGGVTYRKIGKVWYKCLDVGCPNFEEAKKNRERVSRGENLQWWQNYDQIVKSKEELPEDFPYGKVHRVGGNGEREGEVV